MSEENYKIHKDYIAIKRFNKDKNNVEALINFNTGEQIKANIIKSIKKKWNFESIYIYVDDIYSDQFTKIYNSSKTVMEIDSLPHFDYTREAQNVSLGMNESWDQVRHKSFIINSSFPSSCFDWEFYELEWLLQRFESQLGLFDTDSFFITPQYPRDMLNNSIHPDLVLFYIKKYVKIHSLQQFHEQFYGLYLFYKDTLGHSLLRFWYEETTSPSPTNKELLKRLHSLYHSCSDTHPYKIYLFFQANCFNHVKKKFEISKYILLYLSFYGQYVDEFLYKDRKESILKAITGHGKLNYLRPYISTTNDIVLQLSEIHTKYNKNMVWISKKHLRPLTKKNKLLEFVYFNWENIRRNCNLWDSKVMSFSDDQLVYGSPLPSLFRHEWVTSFHRKEYDFPDISSSSHKKSLKKKL